MAGADEPADSGTETDRWYVTGDDDLAEGERASVDVNGREVYVFRVEGDLQAVWNYCTHQGGPVCEGSLHGLLREDEAGGLVYDEEHTYLSCPWHGWSFDIETGEHVGKSGRSLIKYDTVVDDGRIYVVATRKQTAGNAD